MAYDGTHFQTTTRYIGRTRQASYIGEPPNYFENYFEDLTDLHEADNFRDEEQDLEEYIWSDVEENVDGIEYVKPSLRVQKAQNIFAAAERWDEFRTKSEAIYIKQRRAENGIGDYPIHDSDGAEAMAMLDARQFIEATKGMSALMQAAGARVLIDTTRRYFRDTSTLPDGWAIVWPLTADAKSVDLSNVDGIALQTGDADGQIETFGINQTMYAWAHGTHTYCTTTVIVKHPSTAAAIRHTDGASVMIRFTDRNLSLLNRQQMKDIAAKNSQIVVAGQHDERANIAQAVNQVRQAIGSTAEIRISITEKELSWGNILNLGKSRSELQGIWNASLVDPAKPQISVSLSNLLWHRTEFDKKIFDQDNAQPDVDKPNIMPAEMLAAIDFEKAKGILDDVSSDMRRDLLRRITDAADLFHDKSKHKRKQPAQLLVSTTGLGKTRAAIYALAEAAMLGMPVIFLTPMVADAQEINNELIRLATQEPDRFPMLRGMIHRHMPRAQKVDRDTRACLKYETDIKKLEAPGRAPAAWACLRCVHGKKREDREEEDKKYAQCDYMSHLRASQKKMIVIATHAAAADASSLFLYTKRPQPVRKKGKIIKHDHAADGDDKEYDRFMIIDERPETDRMLTIGVDDIRSAIDMMEVAYNDLTDKEFEEEKFHNTRVGKIRTKKKNQKIRDMRERGKSTEKLEKDPIMEAYDWIDAVQPHLIKLVDLLARSAEFPHRDFKIDAEAWADFIKLGTDIPELANRHDGTILEDVNVAGRKNEKEVPTTWIKALAKALKSI